MTYKDVEMISDVAMVKVDLLKDYKEKYYTRSIVAGFFIAVAMILNLVSNNIFFQSSPSAGKLVGALYFSLAILLIVMIGGELFTGNNFVMAFGAFDKKVGWLQVIKIWCASYIGNLVGTVAFCLIFYWAGASGIEKYLESFLPSKVYISYSELFFRAILCNFLVCLAVLCGMRIKDDMGKIVMVIFLISGFTISGFEHSIANMGYYTMSVLFAPSISVYWLIVNLVVVTLGNAVGGGLLLAYPMRKMSLNS